MFDFIVDRLSAYKPHETGRRHNSYQQDYCE